MAIFARFHMIIPLHPRLTDPELRELEEITSEFGVRIQPIHGHERSIYAILGDETSQDLINRIEGLAFVERFDRIQAPYKLMARESKLNGHLQFHHETPGSCYPLR